MALRLLEEVWQVDGQGLEELTTIMTRLAGGEERAVLDLHQHFGGDVARTVQAVLRRRGWRLVKDEVDGLVLDACLAIGEKAPGWSPERGAVPWVWARKRIENCVDRLVGQHTIPLDDDLATSARGVGNGPADIGDGTGDDLAGPDGRPMSDAFAALLKVDARCRALDEAFEQVAISQFDKELLLQYVAEQRSGSRSPAATVGVAFALAPATVRQRVHRTRRRLQQLASTNGRFAWLAELPLLRPAAKPSQTRRVNGQRVPRGTGARTTIAGDSDLSAGVQTSSSLLCDDDLYAMISDA